MSANRIFCILNVSLFLFVAESFLSPDLLVRKMDGVPRRLKVHHAKSGGRAPGSEDKITSAQDWKATPCEPSEARLTIIQITDTYTLANLGRSNIGIGIRILLLQ